MARAGLSVAVFDKRSPPSASGTGRPQLLVARRGDLASLFHLGIDLRDPHVVAPLAELHEMDVGSNRFRSRTLTPIETVPPRAPDLWELASQRPAALVPIAALQHALAAIAVDLGVEMHHNVTVTRVRRHARYASLATDGGASFVAHLVVIATGAARSVAADLGIFASTTQSPRLLMGGVFAATGDFGRWLRAELPVKEVSRPVRCTLLQTPTESDAGTALIVDVPAASSAALLRRCFDRVAEEHELDGPMRVAAMPFVTAVTSVRQRFIAGGNRAPVVLAGDAAQTGHVFGGMTCFANLWLAIRLAEILGESRVTNAVAEGRVNSGALKRALETYEKASRIGARVLASTSRRHLATRTAGDWAMAGVAGPP